MRVFTSPKMRLSRGPPVFGCGSMLIWALWVFQCNFLEKVYSIVGKIIWKAEAASSLRTIINYVVKSCHVRSQKVWFVTQQTVGKKEQGVLVVIVVGSTSIPPLSSMFYILSLSNDMSTTSGCCKVQWVLDVSLLWHNGKCKCKF